VKPRIAPPRGLFTFVGPLRNRGGPMVAIFFWSCANLALQHAHSVMSGPIY